MIDFLKAFEANSRHLGMWYVHNYKNQSYTI